MRNIRRKLIIVRAVLTDRRYRSMIFNPHKRIPYLVQIPAQRNGVDDC